MANKQSFAGWPQGSSCFSVQRPTHAQACLHQAAARQPAKVLSRALFLKRSAAPRPTISHHREARQTVRALPRFAARWDSHHLEIPRDTSPYCTAAALGTLSPACYLQPLYNFFAHYPPPPTDPLATSVPAYSCSTAQGNQATPNTTSH